MPLFILLIINNKTMRQLLLLCLLLMISTTVRAQAPYWGTIFMDPDIITASDPSAIQSTTYAGRGMVTMYDRRVPGWVSVNAYLFNVVWNDGLTSVAQVNPEFGTLASATVQAQKYAFLIGQLPRCLREDVNEIWIHQGVQPFGGGNNSILIHTGQSVQYENAGIIEETLVHEACHTSLDALHAANPAWITAQNRDGGFISTYAQGNPTGEDIAESYLTWLAVRYRSSRISFSDYYTIVQTIPNRLNYFDGITCDLYPFYNNTPTITSIERPETTTYTIYPNPTTDVLHFEAEAVAREEVRIINVLGQDFTHQTSYKQGQLDVSNLPSGQYYLIIKDVAHKVYKQ